MPYFNKCRLCGAALDHGERCDCSTVSYEPEQKKKKQEQGVQVLSDAFGSGWTPLSQESYKKIAWLREKLLSMESVERQKEIPPSALGQARRAESQ